ncbi:MAG: protein kinase [Verrucomicrobiota bacterium]
MDSIDADRTLDEPGGNRPSLFRTGDVFGPYRIVRLLGRGDAFGETAGRHCLTLQDYADAHGGRIPPEKFLPVLKQIVEGLRYDHSLHAVHRDLKSSNILLFRDGVKITDFRLVKVMGEAWLRTRIEQAMLYSMSMGDEPTHRDEETGAWAMLGRFEYMSPEKSQPPDRGSTWQDPPPALHAPGPRSRNPQPPNPKSHLPRASSFPGPP